MRRKERRFRMEGGHEGSGGSECVRERRASASPIPSATSGALIVVLLW